MAALIARRLLAIIPILLIVTFAVFMLISLVPGDAAVTLAGGIRATPQKVQQVREQLHLDEPLLQQYWRWLSNAVQGNLGRSFYSRQPVSDEIAARLPVTLGMIVAGMFVTLLIGVPLGLISGMRAGSRVDKGGRLYASVGVAVPDFVIAIVLVVLFAVQWRLLPPSGYVRFTDSPTEWLRYMALPAVALGIASGAVLSRQLRASLVDTMESNYVRAAWARGGRARTVVGKHALKNAAMPVVTVLGLQLGFLVGGTVLLEQIFSIPGMGSYFLRGIDGFDLPVIQGVTIVFVVFMILMSLAVDVAYGFLNPKVRVH
jgi:peptide/nickel transport system permease protein